MFFLGLSSSSISTKIIVSKKIGKILVKDYCPLRITCLVLPLCTLVMVIPQSEFIHG